MRTCVLNESCTTDLGDRVMVYAWIGGGPPGDRCGRSTVGYSGGLTLAATGCDGTTPDGQIEMAFDVPKEVSFGVGAVCQYLEPGTGTPRATVCERLPCRLCATMREVSCPGNIDCY